MFDLNSFFSSRPVVIAMLFCAVFFLAFWAASVYFVYQDIFNRTKNTLLQILGIATAILFPLLGLIVYFLIRPGQTLDEKRVQLLDEKLLRQEVGGVVICPSCRKTLESEFLFCPNCATKIKETCPKCDKPVEKKFHTCPYCGNALKHSHEIHEHKKTEIDS